MYRVALYLKSTDAQARPSAKTTLARGKTTFACDIQFENNVFNASAEGASAIFIGINKCFFLCGFPNIVIHTSATVVTNESRTDETTVAYAAVKVHPCIIII